MPSSKPALDVWDSCCLLGILNKEKDKLLALLSQTQKFESGSAVLGIPSVVVSETVTLSDGTSAEEPMSKFLDNPYVIPLQSTQEVALLSSRLQFRFDTKRMPELKRQAISGNVPKDNATKLKRADAEVLATALVYKASRLTTYDPFLIFIGKEYITPETGLVIDQPDTSLLPLEFPQPPQATAIDNNVGITLRRPTRKITFDEEDL
jgi:hypothetical protein